VLANEARGREHVGARTKPEFIAAKERARARRCHDPAITIDVKDRMKQLPDFHREPELKIAPWEHRREIQHLHLAAANEIRHIDALVGSDDGQVRI